MPKKVPQAKVKAKAKAAEKAPTKAEVLKDEEGEKRLQTVIDEIFRCYDTDEDGLMERVEFLDCGEKLAKIMAEDFGPNARRAKMAWFKEAGAEGTPMDGMFLTKEKWEAAYLKDVVEKSGVSREEPGKLAEWIWDTYGKELVDLVYPPAQAKDAPASAGGAPSKAPPEYPLTIAFTELAKRIEEAQDFGRNVLLLSSGVGQVETFLDYQALALIDCKKIIAETLVNKSKTKEEAHAEVTDTLKKCMCTQNQTRPVHVRLGNSAFDWTGFCKEGNIPPEVFSPTLWTIEEAIKQGLLDESARIDYTCDQDAGGKKWKTFKLVITSHFDLEGGNSYLFDKLPFFDELAILVVDPKSIA